MRPKTLNQKTLILPFLVLPVALALGLRSAYKLSLDTDNIKTEWKLANQSKVTSLIPSEGLALWGFYRENASRGLLPLFEDRDVKSARVYDETGKAFVSLQRDPGGKIASVFEAPLPQHLKFQLNRKLAELDLESQGEISESEIAKKAMLTEEDPVTGNFSVAVPILTFQQQQHRHVGYMITVYSSHTVNLSLHENRQNALMLSFSVLGAVLCFL